MNKVKPDWSKWLHIPNVHIFEGVWLSLNLEPPTLRDWYDQYKGKLHYLLPDPFWKNFANRTEVACRNVGRGGQLEDSLYAGSPVSEVSLLTFVKWAQSVGWDIPSELAAAAEQSVLTGHHWPWGRYETKLLQIMEAVARKWWVKYDPSDPSTAGTKDVIVAAIVADHGCTKNQAEAIYTVLRADDLPHGPRN